MFEYKVIPAPRRGQRSKTAKGTGGRFAFAMEVTLNELGEDGWEYVRAESLPADERHGVLRKKVEEYHNVLIFRRAIETAPDSLAETTAAQPFFTAPLIQPSAQPSAQASAPILGPAVVDPPEQDESEAPDDTTDAIPDAIPDGEPPVTRAKTATKKPATKKAPVKKAAAKKTPAKKPVQKSPAEKSE